MFTWYILESHCRNQTVNICILFFCCISIWCCPKNKQYSMLHYYLIIIMQYKVILCNCSCINTFVPHHKQCSIIYGTSVGISLMCKRKRQMKRREGYECREDRWVHDFERHTSFASGQYISLKLWYI